VYEIAPWQEQFYAGCCTFGYRKRKVKCRSSTTSYSTPLPNLLDAGHPQLRLTEQSIFACVPPAHCLTLGVQVGLGLAAGRPLRVKELHGASERTVSRFTVSNTVDFLGQQYIVLWMPSLSGLSFFSPRRLLQSHHNIQQSLSFNLRLDKRNTGMIVRATLYQHSQYKKP
jgi:hypothetical protein